MNNKDIDLSFLSTNNINSKGARKAIITGMVPQARCTVVKYAQRVVYPVSSPINSTTYIETLKDLHPASLYSSFVQLFCCDSLVFLFILHEDLYLPSDTIKRICTKSGRMQSQSTMWFGFCLTLRFVCHSQTRPIAPCLLANIQ